jgi:hypothetical protein
MAISAYTQSDYLTFSGTVTDSKTGQPLSYAHVGLPQQGIGTTTGLDGYFLLKVPTAYRRSDLSISFIGYRTYSVSLDGLKSPVEIKLQPSPATLQEVVVMDEQRIEDIIRKAVRAIPDNYPTRPTSMTGFYRESKTDASQNYTYLAEGVLDLYKTSYKSDKEGQTGLIQGRKIILQEEAVASHFGFTAGHLSAHRFDFVKYREDFINEDYFDAYAYRIESISEYAGKPVYVISFDQEGNHSKGRMKGKIYIDTASYAFLRAEFAYRKEALKRYDDYPLYSGSWKGNRYFVNYRQLPDGKWIFSDALREGHYRDGGLYSNEIVITEYDEGKGKPVPYIERLHRGGEFLEMTGTYDENFWKAYNTSPLSEDLYQSVLQYRTNSFAQGVFDTAQLTPIPSQADTLRAVDSQEDESEEDFSIYIGPDRPRERTRVRFQWSLGGGIHALETTNALYQMEFQPSDEPQPIASISDSVNARSFEPIVQVDAQLFIGKYFFINWGFARDTWDSFYRERGFGVGAQLNLSKGRPFFLRASVQQSKLKYARQIGSVDNNHGDFRIGKEKFNSDELRMYYGYLSKNLKGTLSLALEIHPGLDVFTRASYLYPYQHENRVMVREKGQLFRKEVLVPLREDFSVTRNGEPFNPSSQESWMLSAGVVFKW